MRGGDGNGKAENAKEERSLGAAYEPGETTGLVVVVGFLAGASHRLPRGTSDARPRRRRTLGSERGDLGELMMGDRHCRVLCSVFPYCRVGLVS